MNKIAQYLNNNLTGEALTTPVVRLNYSRDRSVLRIAPTGVIFPRSTDDLRKVAKLTSQLGKKGKPIGITARGKGHSQTGAAIGRDFVIDLNRYLNQVLDIDENQGLVHVQAGAEVAKIDALAKSHGLCLPFEVSDNQTIGGVLGSNNAKLNISKVKDISETIDQLEVVLSNGDIIQTKRLSRRELDKKLGLASFEGEVYREIDKIIEENGELLEKIDTARTDNFGYHSIALVKRKDGSFDLTPLLIGSQGTLGLISEAILKLDILMPEPQVAVASFLNTDDALDAQEALLKLEPAYCEIYHADILANAIENGKSFAFYDQALETFAQTPAVYLLSKWNTKNKYAAKKLAKKASAIIAEHKGFGLTSANEEEVKQLESIRDIPLVFSNDQRETQNVALVNGLQIPIFRFKDFIKGLAYISEKLNISLPYYGSCATGIMNLQTEFNLKSTGDKQKVYRLLGAVTKLVNDLDGIVCAGEGEGRLKSPFVYQNANEDLLRMFKQIRKAFDPDGTMNPGVKEPTPLKDVVSSTVNDYYNGIFY